jgi:DNA gyrase subunit A
VRHLVVADTHDKLIFFTDRGRCFQVKTYEVLEERRESRGQSIMQLLMLNQNERVTAVVRVPPHTEHEYMVMATKLGEVKKTPMKNFANVRRDGLIAMDLEPADEFVSAKMAAEAEDAIIVTTRGQAIRFAVQKLRAATRLSGGVKGVRLASGDKVVGMDIAKADQALLVVTEFGFGKRTPVEDYPRHGRGGQGVITFKTNPKTGELIAARLVEAEHELMLISEGGIVLRTPVAHISLQGRPTQGVTLMDVGDNDRVAAVAVIDMRREFGVGDELPTGAEMKTDGKAPKTRKAPEAPKGAARPRRGPGGNGARPGKGK